MAQAGASVGAWARCRLQPTGAQRAVRKRVLSCGSVACGRAQSPVLQEMRTRLAIAPNFIFVEQHAGPHPVSLRADDDLCVTQAGQVEQI